MYCRSCAKLEREVIALRKELEDERLKYARLLGDFVTECDRSAVKTVKAMLGMPLGDLPQIPEV